MAFVREGENQRNTICLFNFSPTSQTLNKQVLPESGISLRQVKDRISGKRPAMKGQQLVLSAYQAYWLYNPS